MLKKSLKIVFGCLLVLGIVIMIFAKVNETTTGADMEQAKNLGLMMVVLFTPCFGLCFVTKAV